MVSRSSVITSQSSWPGTTRSTKHTASVVGISQALAASHNSCCRWGWTDLTKRYLAAIPAATTDAARPARRTAWTGASASGSGGSGFVTSWNGLSKGSGVNSPTTTVPTRHTPATRAAGLHRGVGSLPSGNTNAMAMTPANIVGQAALAHSTAQSPAGSPGCSSRMTKRPYSSARKTVL